MDAVIALVVISAVAVVALAVLSASHRRVRDLEAQAREREVALERQERSTSEGRRVQDLVLGSMEEGVLLLDADGNRAFANAALVRHLGFEPRDLNGVMPTELQRAAKRAGYTGTTTHAELEVGAPTRWLRATALPVSDDGSVLVVVRDVTDTRRLNAVRRDFVTNASHELKTPVASIRAAAETLHETASDDPPAVRRFADQIEKESMRLQRIVSDLLDLSRLESGGDLDERVHLDDVARDEVTRLEDRAEEAGLDLEFGADPVPPVRGSSSDLALLVRNLVDNAIRYTRPDGRIDVRVSSDDGTVTIRVADTGVGIPTKDLPRVFERFYRVDRARSRDTGGTGLGLAIVKHIAENHGGHVGVTSELGAGSTFEVRLPAAQDA
jgi:signal transduction histidine kinase